MEDVTVTVMDEYDVRVDTLLLNVWHKLLDNIHFVGGQDIPLLVGRIAPVQCGLSGIGKRGILGSPHLKEMSSRPAQVGSVESSHRFATGNHSLRCDGERVVRWVVGAEQ